jgi:uncharacterized SAM-binding protein YcdF (DUF218 family)
MRTVGAFAALTVILLTGAIYWRREALLQAIGGYLVVQDALQPADVIHVIAGEDDRTDHAIQLYKQGYGKQILFTGGWCVLHQYYHGEHGRALAMAQGVPEEAIAMDDTFVTSTYSETVQLKAFMDAHPDPLDSVIVVSNDYHMRRARWAARQVLGKAVTVQMAPVPAQGAPLEQAWWTDERSRALVRDEYLKLGYYVLRYQIDWPPLRAWLVSLDRE